MHGPREGHRRGGTQGKVHDCRRAAMVFQRDNGHVHGSTSFAIRLLLDTHSAFGSVLLRATHGEAKLRWLIGIRKELPVVEAHVGPEFRWRNLFANGCHQLLAKHRLHIVDGLHPLVCHGIHVGERQRHASLGRCQDASVTCEAAVDVLVLFLQAAHLLVEQQISGGAREHQRRFRYALGQQRHQRRSCGVINLANAFFEHDGRDRHKNVLQGERAVINLARLYSSKMVDVVCYVHCPVGECHEMLVGFVKVLIPPRCLAALDGAIDGEGGGRRIRKSSQQPADVHLFVHRRRAHFRMRSWRLGARLQLHLPLAAPKHQAIRSFCTNTFERFKHIIRLKAPEILRNLRNHLAGDGATQDSPDGDFLHMLPGSLFFSCLFSKEVALLFGFETQ
mmetsp:Transcript_55393/g.112671  ORF Transcript_55393/g.112671 Transcript_55393/m.112671 type:complete len:392 (-) Transcript_55393:275-1450(-)